MPPFRLWFATVRRRRTRPLHVWQISPTVANPERVGRKCVRNVAAREEPARGVAVWPQGECYVGAAAAAYNPASSMHMLRPVLQMQRR